MSYGFDDLIYSLENMGIADVLMPFILVFTIVYAVLQKSKLLGKDSKKFNVIIALAIGFSVVVPHVMGRYPGGYDVVEIMNEALPQISLIAVAFIMLFVLLGIFGASSSWMKGGVSGLMAIISFIAVALIFGSAAGWWNMYWFYDVFGPDAVSLFVMLLVFGLIIWFVTGDSNGGKSNGGKSMSQWIDDTFKGFGGSS